MASPVDQSQPTWIPPYETIKDCSQGFCSIYCPQWCYIIFPPPPPLGLSSSEEPSSSASTLSPLVIAVIGILASALLLVAYYAIISKYCTRIDAIRRRLQGREASLGRDETPGLWYAPAANGGLDEGVIKSIGQFRYRSGEGPVEEGGDCSVCLGEFRDGEGLRLLPKCSHAFHVSCIDHWLRSHATCPLCRAAVVSPCAAAAPLPTPPPTAPQEQPTGTTLQDIPQDAVGADDMVESGRDGEASDHGGLERAPPVPKSGVSNRGDIVLEFGDDRGAQPIRRSFSMDASRLSRVCVADVLGLDMETAMDEEDMGSTSRGCRTGHDAGKEGCRAPRRPYPAAGPVAMKRSFSSGRFCFTRQGKGSHGGIHGSILPI